MIKYILLSTILVLGATSLGYSFTNEPTFSTYQCFTKQVSFIVHNVEDDSNSKRTAASSLDKAKMFNLLADIRIWPESSRSAMAQANSIINYLPANNYIKVWVAVHDGYWSKDLSMNCLFISEMLQAIKVTGKRTGIFTNSEKWQKIVGDQCGNLSSEPLWYQSSDGGQNFNDFQPFGVWSAPDQKTTKNFYTPCGYWANQVFRQ